MKEQKKRKEITARRERVESKREKAFENEVIRLLMMIFFLSFALTQQSSY